MNVNLNRLTAIAIATAAITFAPASMAGTATGTLLVSAVVLSTCVVAATPIVFGNYSLAAISSTSTITVTCTPDVLTYSVALGTGVATGATTAARKLTQTAGTATLNYGLYSDASHTQNWGVAINSDTVASSAATSTLGAVKTFTVNAQLQADQTAALGSYADAVQITVNY